MIIKNTSRLKPGAQSTELRSLLEGIDSVQLRSRVEHIAKPRHHIFNASENLAVAQWLADVLSGWGYDVTLDGQYRNVVARPRGNHREFVLVGAHYDSVPTTPGADDNGSAVAAMLGCALACSQWSHDLPVLFVAFNCEEDGLLGSRDFVKSFLPKSGYAVRCAHVLEMVGFADHAEGSQKVPPGLPINLPTRGDFLGLLANRRSAKAMSEILQIARTYLPDFPVFGVEVLLGLERHFPVLHRSDHAPFWAEGLASVMWTDTSEFRNPHYHAETDTAATLDYEFLKQVTQVLTACAISQAQAISG